MSKKKLFIIGAIGAIILLGIAVYVAMQPKKTPQQPSTSNSGVGQQPDTTETIGLNNQPSYSGDVRTHSQSEVSTAIASKGGYLADVNGAPNFTIIKTVQPVTGWYVATVIIKGSGQPATVILKDSGNGLSVYAGPGTAFPEDVVLPDAVRKAIK